MKSVSDRNGSAGPSLRYDCTPHLDEPLQQSWLKLCKTLPRHSFVHRPEWHRAVQEHLCRDVSYHCFYDGEDLVAVFPLVRHGEQASWRDRGLAMPTHVDIFISDAVIHERYSAIGWVEVLSDVIARAGGHVMRFHRVPTRSCLWPIMDASDPRLRRDVVGGSTYCDCTGPASLRKLSSRHLHNVDRLRRKAVKEVGHVTHRCFVGKEAALTGLTQFIDIEASSWKGPHGKGTSMSCVPEARAFYRTVLCNFAAANEARVDVLFIGDRPAASNVAVRTGSTWSLLKVGYDDSFSRFGPGNILLMRFLEEAAAAPDIAEVSLVTAPTWAERWHMTTDLVYDVALFTPTPMGTLLAAMHDAAGLARGLMPRAWRRAGP